MEEHTIIKKSGSFVKNSATIKIIFMVFIILLLLIPLSMVDSLIRERGYRHKGVIEEISGKWAGPQTIAGPVITIPYKYYIESSEKDKPPEFIIRYAHFLPDSLKVKGTMEDEIRYRGIYKALLYKSDLHISGKFTLPDLHRFNISAENVLWEKTFLSMGISDLSGVREQIRGTLAETEILMEPGIETGDVFSSGVSFPISIDQESHSLPFSFTIGINGSQNLLFLPLGKENKVSIASTWPSPSFNGKFLPVKHQVSESGFSADWNVLHLNRNYPQSWLGKMENLQNSAFGVSLHGGTDLYQKITRTAKYGLMFILFTFTAFFLGEVIMQARIHPIQYILVGCGVIIFYVLLLAFSEHFGFSSSFLLSVVAVVILIGSYTQAILHTKMALAVSSILTILYGYLFITLQLEDYALLMGSLGLFITLALVMYVTRKIDWYSMQQVKGERGEVTA